MSSNLQTVDRALQLLELLQTRSEITLADASQELGVGSSIAHRLMATLESRGFAQRAAGRRGYRLGPAMRADTSQFSDPDCIMLAQDEVKRLQEATGETIHLAALQGRTVRFFYTNVSRHVMRVDSRVGHLLPAHAASAGQALLSALKSESFDKLYPSESLVGGSPHAIRTRDALREELEQIRARGYARNIEQTEPGVTALAMIVMAPGATAPFAVTVSGPQARLGLDRDQPDSPTERQLAEQLRRTVHTIQGSLRMAGR